MLKNDIKREDVPTCVYHKDCMGGKIVSAEEAQELYKDGWVDTPAKFDGQTEASGNATGSEIPEDPEARQGLILGILSFLDKEKDFTQAGLPEVDAIGIILGFGISAAERDKAWETVLREK